MIVDSAVYQGGIRVPVDGAKDDYPALLRQVSGEGDFVWVGLHEPTSDEMHRVARGFALHPLAVEDSLTRHQRPKLELYDDTVFLVLKTIWYVDENDAVETGQVSIFAGDRYVVSVRVGAGIELQTARHDLERQTAVLGGHGPSAAVHTICDRIVDGYELVAEALQTDVDEVEESVFSDVRTQDARRIYTLKRELAEMRRAVTPLLSPMDRLAAGAVPGFSPASGHFFRDVADHVARVTEAIESLDGLLSSAFEAHLTRVSVQQNDDMRKISAWVAIAGVSTLIAGIYGMNFEHMPELRWRFGYGGAIVLMLASSVLLWRLFKRSGWL
jgi:magnesium transporter